VSVAQNQESDTVVNGVFGFTTQLIETLSQTLSAAVDRIQTGNRVGGRLVHVASEVADFRQFVVVDNRELQDHLAGVVNTRSQEISLGAERGRHRGDHLFADGIKRRVGHLSKLLGEVVKQQPRALRQRGNGSI
jgi:methionine aminopeptidase